MKTITKPVQVGIYERCAYIARIYANKIIITAPYVKWVGNTGCYAEHKLAIRDPVVVARITAEISDDADDSAWSLIGRAIGDDYLAYAGG